MAVTAGDIINIAVLIKRFIQNIITPCFTPGMAVWIIILFYFGPEGFKGMTLPDHFRGFFKDISKENGCDLFDISHAHDIIPVP